MATFIPNSSVIQHISKCVQDPYVRYNHVSVSCVLAQYW